MTEETHDHPDPAPEAAESAPDLGPLLEFEEAQVLEAHDRRHAGPAGEPRCPRCESPMVRCVEQHPAPRSDDSPFRVRLVCGSPTCRSWTTYSW